MTELLFTYEELMERMKDLPLEDKTEFFRRQMEEIAGDMGVKITGCLVELLDEKGGFPKAELEVKPSLCVAGAYTIQDGMPF